MKEALKKQALIAMSGGVDSSVAALLALRMGYDCVGLTIRMRQDTDASDAARVAASLGIRHEIVDFRKEFQEDIIEPFVSSYEAGATPNPCVDCNKRIKFGRLLDYALKMGFDKLVTGHYARIEPDIDGLYRLARAADAGKDQSYFLYGIRPETLSSILFPLGTMLKTQTRAIAKDAGFANAGKPESQDICFVPPGGYADFIEKYRGKKSEPGSFVDLEGRFLGRHSGTIRYTVGQRKGLGVALGRPVFVKEIRPATGEVALAEESEIFTDEIEIEDVNRLVPGIPARAQIMVRYRAKPVWATITDTGGDRLKVLFDEPVRAPARGQSAALYDGAYVIGGGRIR